MTDLRAFVAESNRIEGITRLPTDEEVQATTDFLTLCTPQARDVAHLVKVFQPDARLRDKPGLDVRVGEHIPPRGAPEIAVRLDEVMDLARQEHPYVVHHAYETLHHFTDGNGRSGRALWLWGMLDRGDDSYDRVLELGFLHCWYYQSLQFSRVDPHNERTRREIAYLHRGVEE